MTVCTQKRPYAGAMIRIGVPADLPAASNVYRNASLSNAGDRDNLLAHPGYLMLGRRGLAEGRTHVAEEDGSLVGFATCALLLAGSLYFLVSAMKWSGLGADAATTLEGCVTGPAK